MNRWRSISLAVALAALWLFPVPQVSGQNDANPEASQHLPSFSDAENTITLPEGTIISVRIVDKINSNHDQAGDIFVGTVDPSVLLDDHVVIPRGTEAHLMMVDDKQGKRFHGYAEVEVELISLVIDGKKIDAASEGVQKKKGALSTKATALIKPGAVGVAEVAVAANPIGAVALGGIAVLRAAKVEMKPGSRIAFTLASPLTLDSPMVASAAKD